MENSYNFYIGGKISNNIEIMKSIKILAVWNNIAFAVWHACASVS